MTGKKDEILENVCKKSLLSRAPWRFSVPVRPFLRQMYCGYGRTSQDSRERTRAPVPWPSCEGQLDDWELFLRNSYLSATLDRQRLLVAAPIRP